MMNDVLITGILWVIISIPMIYFIKPELHKSFLVSTIGIILIVVGLIINWYQAYKFEKNI